MKALVSPVVTEKIRSFDEATRRELSAFLNSLSSLTPVQFEEVRRRSTVLDQSRQIFLVKEGSLRIFLTVGETQGEPYFLVLDVTSAAAESFIPAKDYDPRINSQRNPYVNTRINPYVNTALNPYVNTSLNPYVNTSLNPYVNSAINPFINSRLNPFINSQINPFTNSALNPGINRNLNPEFNPNFRGLRFYDLKLFPIGFGVPAANDVVLRFHAPLEFRGIGVLNDVGGYLLFDSANMWTGYLIPDNEGGFLDFDLKTGWRGLATGWSPESETANYE